MHGAGHLYGQFTPQLGLRCLVQDQKSVHSGVVGPGNRECLRGEDFIHIRRNCYFLALMDIVYVVIEALVVGAVRPASIQRRAFVYGSTWDSPSLPQAVADDRPIGSTNPPTFHARQGSGANQRT